MAYRSQYTKLNDGVPKAKYTIPIGLQGERKWMITVDSKYSIWCRIKGYPNDSGISPFGQGQ